MFSNLPHQDKKPALGCLAAPLTARRYFLRSVFSISAKAKTIERKNKKEHRKTNIRQNFAKFRLLHKHLLYLLDPHNRLISTF